ncbi:hypothetical protein AGMMS50262_10780 [Bacteroidia bacterium]|nr:hypothetical protein AGMMS50262_10780 [Bacteroidia bacterium]
MYTIINYILFVLIYIFSLRYIFTPIVLVKGPVKKRSMFPVTGTQRFLLLVLFTGLFSLGSLMANRMLFNIIVCLIAFFVDKNKPVLNGIFFIYTLFIFWLIYEIVVSPVKGYGFRVFLKYLYPFLVFIVAAKVTTTSLFVYKAVKVVFEVGLLGVLYLLVLSRIPFINGIVGAVIFWYPGILDFLVLPICIALAYYTLLKKKKYIAYIALFVVINIIMVNRTGILAASVAIILFSIIRYKIKSLPYVAVGAAILLVAILYVPSVRQKMFKKSLTTEEIIENRETLTTDDIDSSGRFAMWEWSMDRFYKGHEWTGSGLGVLQERFYSLNHPFGNIRIVHNDYVQLLCDTGLVGIFLYLSIFLFIFIHCIILAWNKRNPFVIRFLAMIAGPSTIAMGVASYTDNVVNYSLLTLGYALAVYGMVVGLNQRLRKAE